MDKNVYSLPKVSETSQVIHCRIRRLDNNIAFLWSVVYASNNFRKGKSYGKVCATVT